jgi:hypothetical protein
MTKIALAKDEVDSLAGNMLDAVQSFLLDKYGIEDLPDAATDSLLAALHIWFETQFDVARR